jgi:cobalt/nickel transport system permease protein
MSRSFRNWLLATAAICVVIVVTASLWASADPDGLERVAEDLGFIDQGEAPGFQLLPDYTIPGLDGPTSTIVAGLVGMAIVVVLMLVVGKLLARRSRAQATGTR